jgi:lysophospholipase L1-like esterase
MMLRRPLQALRRRFDRPRQRAFPFVERATRRERLFKRAIVLTTCAAVLAILGSFPRGRYLGASLGTKTKQIARRAFGAKNSRAVINEDWENFRRLGIEQARPQIRQFYERGGPAFQKLLRYAGMDPEHGLVRWGNYNWTLLLSSKVFEADEEGRSYRLRPDVRSIWLRDLNYLAGAVAFYLVPDGPGLAEAVRGTSAVPVETSRQTTNSWGLRGPEPDLEAPLRVLVLGDSYMQGMFVGDDQTPPECLRRYLEDATKARVSVLNTGVLGYSPEQYYAALRAFVDRFRPHFAVVGLFANDCGSEFTAASTGAGDWFEADYWLEQIRLACDVRRLPCLFVPAPFDYTILRKRNPGNYPGRFGNMLQVESPMFLNPTENFLNEHLRTRIDALRRGREPKGSALFNADIGDGHFSPLGAQVWAETVGRRILLVMEDERLSGAIAERGTIAPKGRDRQARGGGPE